MGGDASSTPRAVAGERAILRSLAVRDFRNIARLDLDVPPDGLVLVGENGHGKTNLLEAVHYLEVFLSLIHI